MGGVVRRYIYILTMIINFPSPLVIALFWQQHPYFFVHFLNVFSVMFIYRSKSYAYVLGEHTSMKNEL